ncbi:APC amino acid permease [Marasmius fiardii PR-910]|nr:APC amino acid permease [Marasmius fiardii PR-910]
MASERDPLLRSTHEVSAVSEEGEGTGESFDNVPKSKRQLGLLSAIFLIFNRIIGTGIYATPSNILRASGSVGVALIMWVVGAIIAATGTAVFIELGTGLPRSGGEKNYLEFIYRRPRFLVTCIFMTYAFVMGTATANSTVFAEYMLHALVIEPTPFNIRFVAWIILTFVTTVHGTWLRFGLRLQNALGAFKLFILSVIALCGLLSLAGFPGLSVRDEYEQPENFKWDKFWDGGTSDANSFVTGLYNVIWSFIGYSTANYALSEVRDPVKTIKRAAPLAMIAVTVIYVSINIGYFAVVSKADILGSKRIVAALFFRNLFGEATERILSTFIALSTLGNLLAGQFGAGRGKHVIQELGREGLMPWSAFFASNKPFNAPLAGLFTEYLLSCAFLVLPPPGDIYLFLINLASYSTVVVYLLVSLGLLLLYTPAYRSRNWSPPFRAWRAVVVVFFISNVFLVIVPLIPPASIAKTYEKLPYWSHVVTSFGLSVIGVIYWYLKTVWIPKRHGYELRREWVLQDDGVSRFVFRKVAPVERLVH